MWTDWLNIDIMKNKRAQAFPSILLINKFIYIPYHKFIICELSNNWSFQLACWWSFFRCFASVAFVLNRWSHIPQHQGLFQRFFVSSLRFRKLILCWVYYWFNSKSYCNIIPRSCGGTKSIFIAIIINNMSQK